MKLNAERMKECVDYAVKQCDTLMAKYRDEHRARAILFAPFTLQPEQVLFLAVTASVAVVAFYDSLEPLEEK